MSLGSFGVLAGCRVHDSGTVRKHAMLDGKAWARASRARLRRAPTDCESRSRCVASCRKTPA